MIEPQQLALYRQRAGQIDALHAAGRISGAERRDLLLSLSRGLGIRPRAEQSLNALAAERDDLLAREDAVMRCSYDAGYAAGHDAAEAEASALRQRVEELERAAISAPAPTGAARYWRDDALKSAARIAERYGANDAAGDIRAMLPPPLRPAQGDATWLTDPSTSGLIRCVRRWKAGCRRCGFR